MPNPASLPDSSPRGLELPHMAPLYPTQPHHVNRKTTALRRIPRKISSAEVDFIRRREVTHTAPVSLTVLSPESHGFAMAGSQYVHAGRLTFLTSEASRVRPRPAAKMPDTIQRLPSLRPDVRGGPSPGRSRMPPTGSPFPLVAVVPEKPTPESPRRRGKQEGGRFRCALLRPPTRVSVIHALGFDLDFGLHNRPSAPASDKRPYHAHRRGFQ